MKINPNFSESENQLFFNSRVLFPSAEKMIVFKSGHFVSRYMNQSSPSSNWTWKRLSAMIQQSRHLPQTRSQSTSAEAKPRVDHFRTRESDPRNHTRDHLYRFYRVEDSVNDRLFKYSQIFGPQSREMLKIFDETAFMIREPALEVIDYIRGTNYEKPVVRYVLCK